MPVAPKSPRSTVRSRRDLLVWQESMALVEDVYRCTARFPVAERFGLASQVRRSAVSIASNIAEGSSRRTTAELLHFLYVARGSLAELETQLEIATRLGYIDDLRRLEETTRRLGGS